MPWWGCFSYIWNTESDFAKRTCGRKHPGKEERATSDGTGINLSSHKGDGPVRLEFAEPEEE